MSSAHITLNISQFVYQSRPALVFQNSLKLIPARYEPLNSIFSIQYRRALTAAGAEQDVSKLISKLTPNPRVLLLSSASTKMRQSGNYTPLSPPLNLSSLRANNPNKKKKDKGKKKIKETKTFFRLVIKLVSLISDRLQT